MATTFLKTGELAQLVNKHYPQPGEVYVSNPSLNDAVKTALLLKQPLLLTGEPGTGKTTLGKKLAEELHKISNGEFHRDALFFSTKSNSSANDLFYVYDAISHFQQANIKTHPGPEAEQVPTISNFIKLQALGIAIMTGSADQTNGLDKAIFDQLPPRDGNNNPKSFVVVIDEIDKAPRDFPNDILYEFENLSFHIKEKGNQEFIKRPEATILIILTSNSEKNLPEPFLRRCIFHHIDHPSAEVLRHILDAYQIMSALGQVVSNEYINACLDLFAIVRNRCQDKKPSTAELISWVRYLANEGFAYERPDKEIFRRSLAILVKSKYDLKLVEPATILNEFQSVNTENAV